jgi:hypothetical protein
MAKFKVLRPIELGGTLYLPETETAAAKAKSCGNGADIPVDASGVIELTDEQAAEMRDGQIQALPQAKSKVESPKSKK